MASGSFYYKRYWGQSFLKSKQIAERLVSALNLKEGDVVLEIGPGEGILTEFLIKYPVKVIAVEIDRSLVNFLKERFKGVKNLEIVPGDILKYEPADILKIIGNIPYSISSALLFYLFERWKKWTEAVLTLQKEFADRLLALPSTKDYGALTLISEIYAEKERLFSIPPSFFRPQPKVMSCAIILRRRKKILLTEPDFIEYLKSAFTHRRKTLLNNLADYFDITKERLKTILEKKGFSPNLRAEELSLMEFKEIYDAIKRV